MPPDTTTIEVDPELANRLRDAQQAFDEVKEYLDAIKDEVKHRYADYEHVTGTFNGEQIFTCVRRESVRLNSAQLKREYPDIWRQYSRTSTTQYVSIARLKADS